MKSRWQWQHTLEVYAAALRPHQIDSVTTEDVLGILQPLWQTKQETASRLRGRIERVLDAAKAKGLRTGESPARWRGHLDALLPKRQKLQRGHHPALPHGSVPAFVAELRTRRVTAALALEFAILTAACSGEVLGARWAETDRKAKIWTVPAARMKAGKDHRVPLADRALEILDAASAERTEGDFIFPGPRRGSRFPTWPWRCSSERGCTPIERPAPRWSDYIFKLRKAGLAIETLDEAHGGAYSGSHGRYVLRSPVQVIEEARR